MKIVVAVLASVLLSGCSVSYAHYKSTTAPIKEDIGVVSKKAHFVELMDLVRDNWHKAPTPELKSRVQRLMFEANLVQQCANKKCWLAYGELRITTEEDWIVIEYRDKSVLKIDIREPDQAAKAIYG